MKKRIIAAILCATTILSLTACDKKGGNTESSEITESKKTKVTKNSGEFDIKPSDQVKKMADYENLEITIDPQYQVTDENSQKFLTYLLSGYGGDAYKKVTDRDTVKAGDYVKVNYKGYLKDEAFDGGSAEGALIDWSNNKSAGQDGGFIKGFCDGFEGKKVGEKFSSQPTFPKNYQSKKLAGQKVRFDFEILGIYSSSPRNFSDLKDDEVKKLFGEQLGINTVKDLKSSVKGDLERQLLDQKAAKVKEAVLANSEVTVPEDYLDARVQEYVLSLEKEYSNDTMTIEQYFQSQQYTYDDAVAAIKTTLESQIKTEFLFQIIADKLKVEIDQEGFDSYVSYIISNSNGTLKDADSAYEYFGADNKEYGKKYLETQYLVNLTIRKVGEMAKVTYKAEKTDTQSGTQK